MRDKGRGGVAVALLAALGLYLWARQAEAEPPVFICPYCGATFASQALLDAHIELEHPEEPPGFYWLRPTGHIATGWHNPELAYDGLTDTYAQSASVSPQSWSHPLEVTIPATEVSAVRIWSRWRSSHTAVVNVFYGGAWHSIYEASLPGYQWTEITIPGGAQIISSARVTYYNPTRSVPYTFRVCGFEFYGIGEPPEPPEPPPGTRLFGRVTDKITGVPIPGATGTVYQDKGTDTWDHDLITNAAGYYEIIGMIDDADRNLMVIYAGGYQPYTKENVSISAGDNQLNVQMVPA